MEGQVNYAAWIHQTLSVSVDVRHSHLQLYLKSFQNHYNDRKR